MSYVGAPYNFVPLGTKVYRKDNITRHNEITGLSGYLEYQVTAQTPILVDRGDNHFYKNKDGKAAIPGSTMRGLVRSNMQILSQSSVVDDISNAKLMYRCVGGSADNVNKDFYNSLLRPKVLTQGKRKSSIVTMVKGGYIQNEGGKYYIISTSVKKLSAELKNMNYYVVRESDVIQKKFKGYEALQREPGILQYRNNSHFEKRGKRYVGQPNDNYYPHSEEVYYTVSGSNFAVTGITTQPKEGYKKGTMVSSGFMNDKKVFYIIPEADMSERFEIPQEDIDSFRRDYEGRKNQFSAAVGRGTFSVSKEKLTEKARKFFNLPENGEMKPVFYLREDNKWYFGYTPRLRIFYEKAIYDGLTNIQKDNSLDYCKSLFGFATDEKSYRSRLAFQDAVMDNSKSENRRETRILAEPKPTSYLDYLTGPNGTPAAYRGEFSLRGMKQYWLHNEISAGSVGKNENVGSELYPYPEGTSFTGRIRFTNLQREELGMLLWSLLLEKNSQQNIGKGKPYGYGRISVSLKHLNIQDPEKLYGGDTLCLEPYQEQKESCETYIAEAKADMTRFLGKEVMEYPPVRDFLLMKNVQEIPPESKIHYMSIEGKDSDYQVRMRDQIMLDTIGEILGKEKKKASFSKPRGGYGDRNGRGGSPRQEGGYRGNNYNDKNRNNTKQDWNRRGERNPGNKEEKERSVYSSGGNAGTLMGDLIPKGIKSDQ